MGEVAGGDSLSLATSSPTYTNTHTQTHTVRVCLAVQEVRFVRPKGVITVNKTVTSDPVCVGGAVCSILSSKLRICTFSNIS